MPNTITAFDIGESQVKIVSLSGGSLKKCQALELPDNVVSNGTVLSMDALADFLKEASPKGALARKDAAVILPDRLVFARNVTVPPMTDAQQEYNAQQPCFHTPLRSSHCSLFREACFSYQSRRSHRNIDIPRKITQIAKTLICVRFSFAAPIVHSFSGVRLNRYAPHVIARTAASIAARCHSVGRAAVPFCAVPEFLSYATRFI